MPGKVKNSLLRLLARGTRRFHPRGTNRLLTRLYPPDRRQSDYLETVIRFNPRLRIKIDTRDFLEWRIFFYGRYEPELAREIELRLRPGYVAFDIGANLGSHTLLMSDRAGEGGMVFAAEPDPRAYRRLLENLELNRLRNVIPLPWAFSDRPGTLNLYLPGAGRANRAVSSLYPANVNSRQGEVPVEVRTLDQVADERGLRRLDFIKVDTEGNEYRVLRGAAKSIARFRPLVVFEYDRRAWANAGSDYGRVADFFGRHNYEIFLIGRKYSRPAGDRPPPNCNFLAKPLPIPG